ncbi:MAG: hypothetical protein Q8Q25_00500, partial [bacterium]|nr:hypothetical protein [bacterium]
MFVISMVLQIIWGIFFFSSVLSAHNIEPVTITVATDADSSVYTPQIKQLFLQPQLLERFTFVSDVHMYHDEFYYLVDLKEGTLISAECLLSALSRLIKKNKFSTIVVRIVPSSCGVLLHFDLQGSWTFARLKVQGVLTGKQQYYQHYLMDPGDPFDMVKHDLSIKKIIEVEAQKGYCDASIAHLFSKDAKTKTVTVTIAITRGKLFTIADTHLVMNADDHVSGDEVLFFKREIYRKFLKRLIRSDYKKNNLNKVTSDIKQYLMEHGFLHTTIELSEKIDRRLKQVQVTWNIDLHHQKVFVFWGNYFFSNHQLLENILLFGRSAWLLPASLLAEEIERMYKHKGFWEVHIEVQEDAQRSFFL